MKSLLTFCIGFLLSLGFCHGFHRGIAPCNYDAKALKTEECFFCPFKYGRIADNNNCSLFYACQFYIPVHFRCHESFLYDDMLEECREARLVKCGSRPRGIGTDKDKDETEIKENVFTCPYIWGGFADPEDCSKYIVCAYENPIYFSCPTNELFQRYNKKCLPADQVSCDTRHNPYRITSSTDKVTRGTTITYSTTIPTTSTKAPTIAATVTARINTPPSTHCKEDDIECIMEETKDVHLWFVCPERFGHYSFYGNGRLFIHCDDFEPLVKACAVGAVFSPQYRVCVWSTTIEF